MAGRAHAAVDVSDGLARDAGHLADGERRRARPRRGRAPRRRRPPPRRRARSALSALDLALHGGEDYALLASSRAPIEGFRRIGEVREGQRPASFAPRRASGPSSRAASTTSRAERSRTGRRPGSLRSATPCRSWFSSGALPAGPTCLAKTSHWPAAAVSWNPSGEPGPSSPRLRPLHRAAARLDTGLVRVHARARPPSSARPPGRRRPRRPRRRPAGPARPRTWRREVKGSPASTTGAGFFGQPMTNTGKASAKVKKIAARRAGERIIRGLLVILLRQSRVQGSPAGGVLFGSAREILEHAARWPRPCAIASSSPRARRRDRGASRTQAVACALQRSSHLARRLPRAAECGPARRRDRRWRARGAAMWKRACARWMEAAGQSPNSAVDLQVPQQRVELQGARGHRDGEELPGPQPAEAARLLGCEGRPGGRWCRRERRAAVEFHVRVVE